MTQAELDRRWLDAAARQAMPYLGTTGTAPTVAAILVDPQTQQLLARAIAGQAGAADAAVRVLIEAGDAATGATLYLTLPPAPDSADAAAIGRAGLGRLVIGTGRGLPWVEPSGIPLSFVDSAACRRLHEGWLCLVERERPHITARLAISLDGMVRRRGPAGGPLESPATRRWTEMLRALSDAVMLGWGAANAEDADLLVHLSGLGARQPLRLVMAGRRTYRPLSRLVTGAAQAPTAIVAIPEKRLEVGAGVEMLRVPSRKGRPDLALTLSTLAARGMQRLLVEGGFTLVDALLTAGVIDRFHIVLCDTVVGPEGVPAATRRTLEQRLVAAGLSMVDHRTLGADNLRTFERVH